jgi:hypothetical protein
MTNDSGTVYSIFFLYTDPTWYQRMIKQNSAFIYSRAIPMPMQEKDCEG